MEADELKRRTKDFALQIIRLVESLSRSRSGDVIGQQILRSATSTGANYRAACKARSRADFISKITVVEEEADESQYWLELLADSGILKREQVDSLMREAKELTAIFTASGKTAKRGR
jgi:four helix bundle protein